MTTFRPLVCFLIASTIFSSALADSLLDDVTIYASARTLQLGYQVDLGANTTAPAFTALTVIAVKPDFTLERAISSGDGDSDVYGDSTYLPPNNASTLSGHSDGWLETCIDGRGLNYTEPFLPYFPGNWTFMYYIQYYFPDGHNYTYKDDEVCLDRPVNVETLFAGNVTVEVIPGENGITSIPIPLEHPIATNGSTLFAASFTSTPTGETFIPPSPTSSSVRRFDAGFERLWCLCTLVALLLGIWSGLV